MTTIVGLDLSLSRTGVARITKGDALGHEVTVQSVIVKARHVKRGDPPLSLAERDVRLRKLAGRIIDLCRGANLVVVEGPAFSKGAEAGAWDRAGLWWLIVARLGGAGIPVVEVSPSVLKTYALGKGGGAGTGKDDMVTAAVRTYPDVAFSGNDEADALVVAALAARFAGFPIEARTPPATHLRALHGVKWAT